MALSATTVHEVRPNGNDTNNAGIFDPGVASPGTDYSVSDTPQFIYSDLAIDAVTNTKVTSAAHPFDSHSPGNGLNVTAGTGFTTGRYVIQSVSGNVATLDRAVGTAGSTNGSGYLGGGWASPGAAMAIAVASNTIYIKQGATYGLSASLNVSGGRLNITVGGSSANAPFQVVGYLNNRTLTNSDTPPVLDANSGVGAFAHIALNSNYIRIRNLKMTNSHGGSGATGSSYSLYMNGLYGTAERCISDGMPYGFYFNNFANHCIDCDATNYTIQGFFSALAGQTQSCLYCYAQGTGVGFQGVNCDCCTAYKCLGGAGDGFNTGSTPYLRLMNCNAYACGRHGFFAYYDTSIINGVAVNNGGYGAVAASPGNLPIARLYNFATFGNTSGAYVLTDFPSYAVLNPITLTGDPFTNPAGGDFSLNSTAGAGAACRAAGYPASFYGLSTNSYRDVGAAQHADPAVPPAPAPTPPPPIPIRLMREQWSDWTMFGQELQMVCQTIPGWHAFGATLAAHLANSDK